MKKKTIMIDVDGTVVDSFKRWSLYCLVNFGTTWEELNKLNQLDENAHQNYLKFWELPDLYDDLEPIKGSVGVIKKLSRNYNIIFVSKCVHEHRKSKERFLEKHFEFNDIPYKFIDTEHKELINADYIIDDYHEYLKKCQKVGITPIQFKNEYNSKKFDLYMDWNEIDNFFNS